MKVSLQGKTPASLLCILLLLLLNLSLQEGFYMLLGSAKGAQGKTITFLAEFTLHSLKTAGLMGSNGLEDNTLPYSYWSGAELAPD